MLLDFNQILADFDKHAVEFNFPVLDNANVELADTRLTAYSGPEDWLIVFDFVGYAPPEIEFVDDIYAYGSCVYPEGLQGERVILSQSPTKPLLDPETGECIADWFRWSVIIEGQEISFSPSIDEYTEAGISIQHAPGPGSIQEIEILRFLVHHGHRFFATDKELQEFTPHCTGLKKLLQTTDWQHPDVAAGEKPSASPSIRSLIRTIVAGDSNLFEPGRPNTHWKNWIHTAGS